MRRLTIKTKADLQAAREAETKLDFLCWAGLGVSAVKAVELCVRSSPLQLSLARLKADAYAGLGRGRHIAANIHPEGDVLHGYMLKMCSLRHGSPCPP